MKYLKKNKQTVFSLIYRKNDKAQDNEQFTKAVEEKLKDPSGNYANVFKPSTALCKNDFISSFSF